MAAKDELDDAKTLDLVELVRVMGPAEAEVIKSLLQSEGIPAILRGLAVQSLYPIMTDGMGEIRIFVPAKDLETAQKLLAELPEEPPA